MGLTRPFRLETSSSQPASLTPAKLPDPFHYSAEAANLPLFLEDKEDDLLPAHPDPPPVPPEQPTPMRTPVQPAPAPPLPAAFHTPQTSPQTEDRDEPTRPLSPAQSLPNLPTAIHGALPRASSTSRLTRATAKPDDVLEYVYDKLPLERRLAKMFKKKKSQKK